ncbi:MAG: hypothetical protein WC381_11410 [Kiritimatiellia bacterium]
MPTPRRFQTGDVVVFTRLTLQDVRQAPRRQRLATIGGWIVNCLICFGQFLEHDLWYLLRHGHHTGLCNIIHVGVVVSDSDAQPLLVEFQCPGGLRITPLVERRTSGHGWLLPLKDRYRTRILHRNALTWLDHERGAKYNLLGLPLAVFPWVPILLRLLIRLLRKCGLKMSFCSEGVVRLLQFLNIMDPSMPGLRRLRVQYRFGRRYRRVMSWVPNACRIDPDSYSPDDVARLMIFDKSEAVPLP